MPPPPTGTCQPIAMSRSQMQLHLSDLHRSTAELRKQLTQLRRLQVKDVSGIILIVKSVSGRYYFFSCFLSDCVSVDAESGLCAHITAAGRE